MLETIGKSEAKNTEHALFTFADLSGRISGSLQGLEKGLESVLREWPAGFKGSMNARKYVVLAKASKATATQDLQELVEKQVCMLIGGGRSTRSELRQIK